METNARIWALAEWLEVQAETIEHCFDGIFTVDAREYLVLTDNEADEAFDQTLDGYLDECVKPQIPDELWLYFDQEKWKREAAYDGRGHVLSHYDGHEHESGDFFIYRMHRDLFAHHIFNALGSGGVFFGCCQRPGTVPFTYHGDKSRNCTAGAEPINPTTAASRGSGEKNRGSGEKKHYTLSGIRPLGSLLTQGCQSIGKWL